MRLKVGDRAVIGMNIHTRSIAWQDVTVIRGLEKRQTDLEPTYKVRTDEGIEVVIHPAALFGPLIYGNPSLPSRWSQCVFQPRGIKR